jgi:uncharacterized membrane protein (UPF0136 family)
MSHYHGKGLPNCQNCQHSIAETDKFCLNCGQQNTDAHVSLHDLWHELTHYFTHVDNKIFVSIRDLLIPGKLTDEFFKGHRRRYIHPINLFFVVGVIVPFILGQMFHNQAVEGHLEKGFIKEKELYRNDLLFEMDSIVKHDSSRFGGGVRPLLDSFLLENYQRSNVTWSVVDTSDKGNMIRYYRTLDKMRDARKAIRMLTDTLQIDKGFVDKPLIQKRLDEYTAYSLKLNYDSITTIAKAAAANNKTYKEIEDRWAKGAFGYNLGKNWASKGKIKPLSFDSLMRYPADYDAFQVRMDSIRRIIKRDSTNLGIFLGRDLKIAELDLSAMSPDAIVKKYNITDWKGKMAVKQAKKFGQQGLDGLMKTYSEKSLWITILSILPAAWLLLLMYKSQNRVYVEHLVFLIHYSTLSFVASALLLIQKDWIIYVSLVVSLVLLTLAIKRFYKQSWGKSILKSVISYTFNTILGTIIAFIGVVLSILFS